MNERGIIDSGISSSLPALSCVQKLDLQYIDKES